MTWYPIDTQGRDPSVVVKTLRKASAALRWVVLVVISGLALAALVGIALSALVTAIEHGL
jgi:hypothetical protein